MKLARFTKKALLGICCTAILATTPARAGDEAKVVIEEPESSTYDDIWGLATLYKGDENTFIQKLSFTGRLQADAAFFYPTEYDDYEKLLWRRLRAGFKMKFLNHFTLHSEADLNLNNTSQFYGRLTDTYFAWQANDSLKIKVGKISAPFTMDGHTSSKKLLRPERSNLANNLWFPNEYHSGINASGDIGNWEYLVGVYSSQAGREFGDFDGGMFGLVSLGYNFADAWDMDKALLRLDYVYNDQNANNSGTRNLAQVLSFNGQFEKGKWGLLTDIAGGEGYGSQSNLFAIAIMPYYDFTDKLQGVMSYNFVSSDDPSGVRLDRYENRTTRRRFDKAHEFFAGVNYYIYGHKLKWQNGVEYTTASNSGTNGNAYNGWGFTSAFRLSW